MPTTQTSLAAASTTLASLAACVECVKLVKGEWRMEKEKKTHRKRKTLINFMHILHAKETN